MAYLNLGIVAHVDAGKTTLTERLLFDGGILDKIGSVDEGSTATDSMALERQRGITIRAGVVSFPVGDLTVNLLDTPGHPDFVAEVERALSVLDGAVLVISAVEGVQVQTRVFMRALQRLRIPTILFVNKIDRRGARYDSLLASIAERLTPNAVAMGSVTDIGTRGAAFVAFTPGGEDFAARIVEAAGERDDSLLEAYVDDGDIPGERLMHALRTQARGGYLYPVFFGSAVTGAGVPELTAALPTLLPSAGCDDDGPLSATVFKIERGSNREKIAYSRMFSGTLRMRDRVPIVPARRAQPGESANDQESGDDRTQRGDRVTGLSVVEGSSPVRSQVATSGQIALVWGLESARIGDSLGSQPEGHEVVGQFSPPTLETVVVPAEESERGRLHAALTQLAEQDPLIGLRRDEVQGNIAVSLYGEVQKEVIEATLATEFDVRVNFRETTTICIEHVVGTGSAVEFIGIDSNPFLATVGLRVEPAEPGTGVTFLLEVELGSMPYALIRGVEEAVHTTLEQGLRGWQVVDCRVSLTESGYLARQSHAHGTFDKSMSSTAGDFRNLTPLVLMSALRQAGTVVYEPVHYFRLETPATGYGAVLPVLAKLGALPQPPVPTESGYLIEGTIPAGKVYAMQTRMPGLTSGEGVLETAFDHYEVAQEPVPVRSRTDADPLNRARYLQHVLRRT